MRKIFPPLIAVCSLAACQTNVIISEVKAERTPTGEVEVGFKADQDLEHSGFYVTGQFRVPPEAVVDPRRASYCCASLDPHPGTFAYSCRIPARAEQTGEILSPGPGGKSRHVSVDLPYDFTGPGEVTIHFSLQGGACGFRGLSCNTVALTLAR